MAAPGRGGGGGGGGGAPTTDAAKLKTAIAQLRTATGRLKSGTEAQSPTLESYADTGKQGFKEQAADFLRGAGHVLGTGIAEVERPFQGILHGIENRDQGLKGVLQGIGQGLQGGNSGFRAIPENSITPTQAVGVPIGERQGLSREDAEKALAGGVGGKTGAAADFTTSILLDPLTYLGGAGAAGKVGLKALEKGAGKEVALKVAQKGAKGLSDAEYSSARQVLSAHAAERSAALAGLNPTKAIEKVQLSRAQKMFRDPEAFASKVLGERGGNVLTREVGKLSQPVGVRFAGKTVLPTAALRGTAVGTAAAGAGEKIANSTLGRDLSERFQTNTMLKPLGNDTRGNIERLETGAKGKAALQVEDAHTKLQRAIDKTPDAERLLHDVIGPALEAGTHKDLFKQFKAAGHADAADLVRKIDQYRQAITDQKLAAGTITRKQLHNRDTYIPWVETPEFRKWRQSQGIEGVGQFNPQTQTGVLRNVEPHLRTLGATNVKEANAIIAEKAPGAPKALVENPINALLQHGAQASKEAATMDVVHGLAEMEGPAGHKLLIEGVDHSSEIKLSRRLEKQYAGQLNKEIASLDKRIAQQSTRSALGSQARKTASATLTAAEKNVEKLAERVRKLEGRSIAAGTEKRTARTMGTTTKWSGDELVGEAVNRAPSVQQRIGSSQAAAKFTGTMLTEAKSRLAAAEKDVERAQARLGKISDGNLAEVKARKADLLNKKRFLKTQMKAYRDGLVEAQKVDRPADYVKIPVGTGHYYGPKPVADYLSSLETKLSDHNDALMLGKLVEGAGQWWKNWTLNLGPFAVGRTTRDGFSNLIQMWQKGFKDPTTFGPATDITRHINKERGAGKTYVEAVASLPEHLRHYEELMADRGTVYSGQLRSDLAHSTNVAVSRGDKVKGKISIKNAEALGTKSGARLNTFVDDTSRRAMFIDQYLQHGDADLAAKTTDEALFNYAKLTKFEKGVRKWAIPFYTFTKNNVALQLWALSHVPQKTTAIEKLRNELISLNADETGNDIIPGYSLEGGQIPLGKVGGTPLLGAIQTPQQAADQSLQPLADILSFIGPERGMTQGGVQGAAQGLAQQFGGPAGNAAKALVEEASGNDIFTGAPLKKTKADIAGRVFNDFAPRGSQVSGTERVIKEGTPAERAATALKYLGVSSTAVTDSRQVGEAYRRKRAVEDSADRQNIPTAAQLKKKSSTARRSR